MGRAKAAVLPVPVWATPKVVSRQDGRDRLGLDGSRARIAGRLEGMQKGRGQAEHVKIGQYGHLSVEAPRPGHLVRKRSSAAIDAASPEAGVSHFMVGIFASRAGQSPFIGLARLHPQPGRGGYIIEFNYLTIKKAVTPP